MALKETRIERIKWPRGSFTTLKPYSLLIVKVSESSCKGANPDSFYLEIM